MAFNQFMHPRNIYRIKPNYIEMANVYSEFKSHLSLDSNGKLYLDYSNVNALRSLTQTLLKKDFGLEVSIPEGRLIPTIPMRLNYILWIEDLLIHAKLDNQNITGFDVGTGCCAIFPLLGTVMNRNWTFLASEIDSVNLQSALENISKNGLSERISIFFNNHETLFLETLKKHGKINFLMCNPPFFADTLNDSFGEEPNLMTSSTFHSTKTNTPDAIEAVVDGGEVEFVKRIIDESLQAKLLVDIYTVMLGRKKSYLQLKALLKEQVETRLIASFATSELCQGNTKRWSLAWTLDPHIDLSTAPKIKCSKSKPLVFKVDPNIDDCEYDVKSVSSYIENLLQNDLAIFSYSVIETKKSTQFDIKANNNTWKNQRRKRRQQNRLEANSLTNGDVMEIDTCGTKRNLEDDDSEKSFNSLKNKKQKDAFDTCKVDLTYLLHCGLKVKRDKQDLIVKIYAKEMSQNKESTYQIFQYFKNKLTL